MTTPAIFKKSSDIAEYLTEVLGTIRTANGYLTDLGTLVYRGRLKHDEDRVPYAVLIEGEDKPGDTGAQKDVTITQDFVLGAYVFCDVDNPNDAAHDAIKDIKKAVFSSDLARKQQAGARGANGRVQNLTYKGKDIGPRADGRNIVFAVVHISVTFAEDLLDA
jgi:hypothetical protein